MKKILLRTLALFSFSLALQSSFAATTTGSLPVSASVAAACRVSTGSIDFGTVVSANTGAISANGTFTATCTRGTAYSVSFSTGTSSDFNRYMRGTGTNTERLYYNVYIDSAKTFIANAGSGRFFGTGDKTAQIYTLYGNLPLNQFLKRDTYSDTFNITLTY